MDLIHQKAFGLSLADHPRRNDKGRTEKLMKRGQKRNS
jgi:hypothetical protein